MNKLAQNLQQTEALQILGAKNLILWGWRAPLKKLWIMLGFVLSHLCVKCNTDEQTYHLSNHRLAVTVDPRCPG